MTSYNNPAFTQEVNEKPTNEISTSGQTSGSPPVKEKYRPTCCTIFWIVIASLSLIMNIAMLAGGYQAMFDAIFKTMMQLQPGSISYGVWETTPFPMLMYLYFYNITNPLEYQQGGKIKFEEVGPIVYKEYHKKRNVTWHDSNHTVSYMQERWWTFDDERSVVKKDAPITAINIIPVSAAYSNRWSPFILEGLNGNLKNVGEELFVHTNAGDLLFDGLTTPLLNMTHNIINGDLPPLPEIPDWLESWLQNYMEHHNITIPPLDEILEDLFPPGLTSYDKFGWFYGRNHSTQYDGHWNMHTGVDDLQNLGIMGTWQFKDTNNFFASPCNKIEGSSGDIFAPNQNKTYIQFWTPDLCMSVKLYYKEDYTDENGLELSRYFADNRTFSNGSTWPENECYCVHGTCAASGLVNAESCRYGSPSFISYPHFYMADPWVKHNTEGIKEPDPEKDMFFIDMFPETGIPAHVSARMQINMHVQPYKGETYCYREVLGVPTKFHKGPCIDEKGENVTLGKVDMLADVVDGLVPLIWFEEVVDIPPEMATPLGMLMFMIRSATMTIIFSVSIVISAAILGGCSYRIYRGKKNAQ